MNWLQRFRLKNFLQNSVWLPPLFGMIMAILIHRLVRWADLTLGLHATITPDGARALLSALATSMFTFIVFIFSILLLAVQLASAQLTPRIIVFFYRKPVLKFSLTIFVFTFTYSLGVLSRIGDFVNQMSIWIAVYSSIASIGIFLYMIDNVGKSLRPISLMNMIGEKGQEVILDVYPIALNQTEVKDELYVKHEAGLSRIIETTRTGVVLAFDIEGLADLATGHNCLIEFVPQVGDFMTNGDPLFKVYGDSDRVKDDLLNQTVAIGPERTMQQDPAFAFRIIVDIASKALSPAINDPTTAVLALDQIHRLLRTVAGRKLNTGHSFDTSGVLRLVYRTPDWEDFIGLAITEIRQYGKDSLQVVRRMRAMLVNLIDIVPPSRSESLRRELEVLDRGVDRNFYEPEDRKLASSADSLGMG
jgi:uncharacterized membrane protein